MSLLDAGCEKCMPKWDYVRLPPAEILAFEELAILVDVFADLGVDRVCLHTRGG